MDSKGLVTLSLVGVIVVVHVLETLFAIDILSKLNAALDCCWNLRSSVREWWKQEVGMLDGEVQSRLAAWQLEQFKWMLQLSSHIFLYMAIVLVLDAVSADPDEHTVLETVFILLGYALTLMPLCCSCLIGVKTMDVWYFAIMATVVLHASPVPCGRWDCSTDLVFFSRMVAILLTAARMSTRGALFWSLALLGATAPRWWYDDTTIHMDVGFSATVLLLTMFLERWTISHIRRTVENDYLDRKQYAYRGLLRNFCDVVVELDDKLRITGPSQDLAVFLLHGPRVSLTSKNFQDFLTNEKKDDVVERLQRNNNQRSIAEVVHAQMRGVGRSTLDVELFCLGFDGPTGGTCYIVGIREYSDEMHGVPKAQPTSSKKKKKEERDSDKEKSKGKLPIQHGLQEEIEAPPEQEVSATVDTADPDLPIVKSSATFQLLIGSTPSGSSLRRLVCNGSAFSSWVQLIMNRHLAGQEADEDIASQSVVSQSQIGAQTESSDLPPGDFTVKFRPQAGVQTVAKCSLVFVECSMSNDGSVEESDRDEPLVCKFIFTEVERKRCNRSRSSAGSSRGSSSASVSSSSLPSFAGAFDVKQKRLASSLQVPKAIATSGTKPQPDDGDTGSLQGKRRPKTMGI